MAKQSKNHKKRHSERFKKHIANLVEDGEAPAKLSDLFGIPLSTIYYWHDEYKPQIPVANQTISRRFVRTITKNLEKTQSQVNVLRSSPFIQNADLTERMIVMEDLLNNDTSGTLNAGLLCDAFGIDKATFWNHRFNGKHGDTDFARRRKRLESRITKIYLDSNRTYGAHKVWILLKDACHEPISEDYVRKLMRELGYKGATPRQIKRELRKIPDLYAKKRNILGQDFSASKPNQKWVMDCKNFVGAKGRRRTICAIIDLYACRVVAYHIGSAETTNLITKTFRKALKNRNITDNVILHTDNGSANISIRFNRLLRENGFVHSYSEKHNPLDNAPAESFFSHFSAELLVDAAKNHPFRSERDMQERIDTFIENYNSKRPHNHNDGLTPKLKEADYAHRHKIKVDRTLP